MQQIVIKDGTVELLEVGEVKRAKLSEFYEALVADRGFSTPLVPPGTIHYMVRGRTAIYTIELAPARRKITYREREGRSREFALPCPWMYFVISFCEKALDQVRVFFAPAPLKSLDDDLYHVPLPNRYSDGLICMGSFKFEITSTLPSKVQEAVRFYLESHFTDEVMDSFRSFMPEEIKAKSGNDKIWLEGWSLLTDEELPNVRWKKYKPLAAVLDQILERR